MSQLSPLAAASAPAGAARLPRGSLWSVVRASAVAVLGQRFRRRSAAAPPAEEAPASDGAASLVPPPAEPPLDETAALAAEMQRQGRYALLLRPQLIECLRPSQREQAWASLDREMALTAAGPVLLRRWRPDLPELDEVCPATEVCLHVPAFHLDRDTVTNAQFQRFVEAGGYTQQALWEEDAWPATAGFVDRTGHSGPRFWSAGRPPRGAAELPVTGVSWYEAAAYARWVGKRLPADAEWVRAAAWPVASRDGRPQQRRYPWGDLYGERQANLWTSGRGGPAPAEEFAGGESPAGVRQLIGNVWEWMHHDFQPAAPGLDVELAAPMKSLRGGAFDTYFDAHAACQFQSAERLLARRHNIGFRCAVAAADLAAREEPVPAEDAA